MCRDTSQTAASASTDITVTPFSCVECGGGNPTARRRSFRGHHLAAPSASSPATRETQRLCPHGVSAGGGRRRRPPGHPHSLPLHLCFTRMDGMRRGEKEEILLLLCDGGGGWDVKRLLRWCFALPYLVAAFVKSRRCFMMIMATLKLIL